MVVYVCGIILVCNQLSTWICCRYDCTKC